VAPWKRRASFYDANQPLVKVATKAHDFCRELLNQAQSKLDGQEQTVIWMLAASSLKEFEEIALLCCNGFGTGAVKLMRSFYERVTILSYLARHNDSIQRFIDYSFIQWRKLLVEAEEIHSEFKLAEGDRKTLLENYERLKDQFREQKCPTCKRRPPKSWIEFDTKTMASQVSGVAMARASQSPMRVILFIISTSRLVKN